MVIYSHYQFLRITQVDMNKVDIIKIVIENRFCTNRPRSLDLVMSKLIVVVNCVLNIRSTNSYFTSSHCGFNLDLLTLNSRGSSDSKVSVWKPNCLQDGCTNYIPSHSYLRHYFL